MNEASYPRPVCSHCGMPMRLDTAAGVWRCDVCKDEGKPQRPSRIEPEHDLARPKGWLLRLILVIAVISALAFMRVFLL